MKSEAYKEFLKFVNENRRNILPEGSETNCSGTALYLTGEIDKESYKTKKDTEKILENLQESNTPEPGYLIEFQSKKGYSHLAIIANKKPLRISSRDGTKGSFQKNAIFEEMKMIHSCLEPKYYIPSKLANKLKE